MARVAAIGEWARVQGFALAGALVLPVDDAAGARAAWDALPDDVAVVILTRTAAAAVPDRGRASPGEPLTVELPP